MPSGKRRKEINSTSDLILSLPSNFPSYVLVLVKFYLRVLFSWTFRFVLYFLFLLVTSSPPPILTLSILPAICSHLTFTAWRCHAIYSTLLLFSIFFTFISMLCPRKLLEHVFCFTILALHIGKQFWLWSYKISAQFLAVSILHWMGKLVKDNHNLFFYCKLITYTSKNKYYGLWNVPMLKKN